MIQFWLSLLIITEDGSSLASIVKTDFKSIQECRQYNGKALSQIKVGDTIMLPNQSDAHVVEKHKVYSVMPACIKVNALKEVG